MTVTETGTWAPAQTMCFKWTDGSAHQFHLLFHSDFPAPGFTSHFDESSHFRLGNLKNGHCFDRPRGAPHKTGTSSRPTDQQYDF